ncbi:hypothetical protein WA026_002359 [Henosepilachna vigintioctopunctata]|uniref:MADF domain-containing protein n=1 Tax=Henosepilachna vigintioctopunctata TaxID=420089 RepID=A0AAW1U0X7_9CUCU
MKGNNNLRYEMWTDTVTILLIDEYRRHPCLWDPSDPHFKMMGKKSEAWQEVALAMECSVPEIKRKMASVLASFRRERKRERKSMWFAYKPLSFLLEKFNSKKEKSVEGEEDDELIGTEEWWNEHDSIIDEPELVLSNVEEDDKSNIKLHTEDHDNIPSSSQIENAQMAVDTEENSNQQQRRYSRKRLRTSRVTEDNTIDQENSTHPNTELKDQQNTKSICGAFGSYVSAKLESYSEYTRIMVEHKINEILFQADFGTFNEPTPNQQN